MAANLIIAGNQKCGTTALFDMLAEHPEVAVPHDGRKELHFFNEVPRLTWYNQWKHRRRWAKADRERATVCLEATPILGYCSAPRTPDCLELVKQFDPEARIILLFRDPVDRAYSQWSMELKRGNTDLDFEAALQMEEQVGPFHPVHSYRHRGEYDRIAENALRTFEAEQLLFLKTEELLHHPERVLPRVQRFAGIEEIALEHKESFRGSYDSKMAPETREKLSAHYAPHNVRFSELTGLDVADWAWPEAAPVPRATREEQRAF